LEQGAENTPMTNFALFFTGMQEAALRTLDKKRLVKLLGRLQQNEIHLIDQALKIHLALS